MIILGIDPGFGIVGYGVLSSIRGVASPLAHGVITTPADMDFQSRLNVIYQDLFELCNRFHPDAAAVEQLFYKNNQKTVIQVAEARGVTLLALRQLNIPTFEYTPLQVKMAMTGYGQATKKQVMEMTRQRLKMAEVAKPDDAADALAIALTHNGVSWMAQRRVL